MPRLFRRYSEVRTTIFRANPRGLAMRRPSPFAIGLAALVGLAQPLGCAAVNKARDLSTVSQNALKLWMTVDARVDVDGGRVAQWNDISHGENHAKQNSADKSPAFESTPDAGDMIVFGNTNAYLSTQPVQLFETAGQGLTAFIMFKHFENKEEKPVSQTLVNYGASGLKMPNNNLEIGVKHKGNACFFFVHRGSGRMTLSGKVPLKPDDQFHLLTVKIAGDAPEGDALSVSFAVDGKPVKSTEKNKGWLKHGKYPTMSAPIDIGGRVDGNKYEGTIGAHMKADADMVFKGVISEVMIYGKELTNDKTDEFEAMLLAAQEERTSDACLKGETGEAKDEDSSNSQPDEMPEEEGEDSSYWDYVTCMSSVKLRHKVLDVRLHSADIAYGSGSKQQAVTGNPDTGDPGSYWQIRSAEGHGGTACVQGNVLNHGDKIRLMHLRTKKNLHSHQYQSPLSQKQEVSAFGENGEGDAGDVWELMVREKGDVYSAGWGGPWMRDSIVRFKHVVTGEYLFSHRKTFNNGPVDGMNEITCSKRADDRTLWSVDEGIFHPRQAQ